MLTVDSQGDGAGAPVDSAIIGTLLAFDRGVLAARYRTLREEHLLRSRWAHVGGRMVLIVPAMTIILATLKLGGIAGWRIALVGSMCALSYVVEATISSLADASTRPRGFILAGFLLLLLSTVAATALTGGLASPLVVTLPAIPFAGALSLGRGRESTALLGAAGLLVAALLLLPADWAGSPPVRPFAAAVTVEALVLMLLVFRREISDVLEANERAHVEVDRLREESLVHLCERHRSLQSIGARVAHELKNPLAAIKGLVQLLQRGQREPRDGERLGVVAAEIARMEAILRDYLSYARPLEELRLESVALGPLARDVATTLAGRAESAGVSVHVSGDAVATADRRRLKEALINLVQNAIEACRRGDSVDVEVRGHADRVEVVVADSGRGMTADALARIGTPFFTTRDDGTGLGVVLARSVIVHHGGNLAYRSAPGAGTRAIVRLPAEGDGTPRAAIA